MKAPSRRQRIAAQLADLTMPGALESLDDVLARVDGGGFTAAAAIQRLLAARIALRNSRRPATAMLFSRLPEPKTLADFDFSFQPSIRRERIGSWRTAPAHADPLVALPVARAADNGCPQARAG